MKKVSVIIPVYNMENLIEEGIRSVVEQTYENLEIIIIDDGSKDGSYLKCLAEADKDKRIAVFGKNNEGPAAARNLALRKATGDYVYFFDVDDYLYKNAIERLVSVMEREEVDLVVCGFDMFDGKKVFRTVEKADGLKRTGAEARADYSEHLGMYNYKSIQGAAWYKLFKMDIIRGNKIEFPLMRKNEDDVFVARYVNYINGFYMINDTLCRYRVNSYKKAGEKYAFDCFDAARESTMELLRIVSSWNSTDKKTRDKVYEYYFHKTFGSFTALFNKHLRLNKRERMTRIKEIADTFAADLPPEGTNINHRVYDLILLKNYKGIYRRIQLHLLRHKFD